MKTERRSALKKMLASFLGIGIATKANATEEKITGNVVNSQDVPLVASYTKHGNLVYLSGRHPSREPRTIENHTDLALKAIETELESAGSSMEKVLKVTVFLDDIANFNAMNEVYRGRFGANPPCRSTVAVAKGGIPGNSLIQIDCIAYI